MSSDFHFTQHPSKSELIAHLLNLMFPGVGLIYWRRESSGFYWCILSLGLSIVGLSLWILTPFLPQLLASLFALGWLMIQWHVFDQVRELEADQSSWRRRSVGVTPFLGLAVFCLSLVCLTTYVTLTRVYSFVYIHNHSMFPQMLPGDVILVDRRIPEDQIRSVGQLIAYDSNTHGVVIARVLASNKNAKSIEIQGVSIQFDHQALTLQPIEVEVPHLCDEDRQRIRSSQFFIESLPGKSRAEGWLVSQPLNNIRPPLKFSGRLGKNALLVIPDVRYPEQDQVIRTAEIIDRARVIGIPVMIVTSTHPHPRAYSRRGLTLH
jgi:hypothetical protein